MNTLRQIWDNGLQLHHELYLTFENQVLIDFQVDPIRVVNHYTKEVVNGLVNDLIENGMITFFDDVPQMSVHVPIHEIGIPSVEGNDPLYIETFHYDMDDNSLEGDGKICDVPCPLHIFLGFEMELNDTDI
jgi:hypothetical protein